MHDGRQGAGLQVIPSLAALEDEGQLPGDPLPGDGGGLAGNDLEEVLVVGVVDVRQARADGGQDVNMPPEHLVEVGVGLDPAAGAEAQEALFRQQVGVRQAAGLHQLVQGVGDLLGAPVAVPALGEHLRAAEDEARHELLLVLLAAVDKGGVVDGQAVDRADKRHGKGVVAHAGKECGQVLAPGSVPDLAADLPDLLLGQGIQGELFGKGELVAAGEQGPGVGQEGVAAVVIGMKDGDGVQGAVLLPFGKGGNLIKLQVDRAVPGDEARDHFFVPGAQQLREIPQDNIGG